MDMAGFSVTVKLFKSRPEATFPAQVKSSLHFVSFFCEFQKVCNILYFKSLYLSIWAQRCPGIQHTFQINLISLKLATSKSFHLPGFLPRGGVCEKSWRVSGRSWAKGWSLHQVRKFTLLLISSVCVRCEPPKTGCMAIWRMAEKTMFGCGANQGSRCAQASLQNGFQ